MSLASIADQLQKLSEQVKAMQGASSQSGGDFTLGKIAEDKECDNNSSSSTLNRFLAQSGWSKDKDGRIIFFDGIKVKYHCDDDIKRLKDGYITKHGIQESNDLVKFVNDVKDTSDIKIASITVDDKLKQNIAWSSPSLLKTLLNDKAFKANKFGNKIEVESVTERTMRGTIDDKAKQFWELVVDAINSRPWILNNVTLSNKQPLFTPVKSLIGGGQSLNNYIKNMQNFVPNASSVSYVNKMTGGAVTLTSAREAAKVAQNIERSRIASGNPLTAQEVKDMVDKVIDLYKKEQDVSKALEQNNQSGGGNTSNLQNKLNALCGGDRWMFPANMLANAMQTVQKVDLNNSKTRVSSSGTFKTQLKAEFDTLGGPADGKSWFSEELENAKDEKGNPVDRYNDYNKIVTPAVKAKFNPYK